MKKEIPAGPHGRKGLLILVGGMTKEGSEKCAEETSKAFFRTVSVPHHDILLYKGIDAKGDILKHPTALKDAYEAGSKLWSKASPQAWYNRPFEGLFLLAALPLDTGSHSFFQDTGVDMDFIAWSEKYSVHVAAIDDQHKKLFDLVNALYEAMEQGKGNVINESIMSDFAHNTKDHFRSKERLLEANF